MADSLVLKGVKDVVKHKGSEMLLTRPKRGGDSHLLAKWWSVNPVNTVYVTCSVFKVTDGADSCYLAIETSEKSQLRIDHAGGFEFNFYGVSQIGRGALYNDAMELIEHYAFPKISGGKIMTITPAGAAAKPGGGGGATAIGNVVASGATSVDSGDSETYTVATASATASGLTYQWSATGDASITAGATTNSATIEFTYNTGASGISCVVTSSDPNVTDSPATSNTVNVTIAAPAPATGPADSVTLVGTTSTQGDGTETGIATTSANGSGLTVTYDVSSGTASNLSIAAAGNDYQDGDSFTVDGDTGVTGTVSLATLLTANSATVDVVHVVTESGGDYYIDGVANAEVTANAGETIYFDLSDASMSGHPFAIYTDSTKTTTVTVGIQTSNDGSILLFTPPIAGSFSYQCTQHANMGGDITVS